MKKTLYLLLSLLLTITVLTSCDSLTSIFGDFTSVTTEPEVTTPEPEVTTPEPEVTTPEPEVTTPEPEVTTPEPEVTTPEPEVTTPEPEVTTPEPEVTTPEPEVTTPEPDVNPDEPLHTDFTAEEKALFNDTVGLVIPFVPNDEYHIGEAEIAGGRGINFYTFGNTQAEFEAYLDRFSSYNYDGTQEDDYGYTWYLFSKNNVFVDVTYYLYEDSYVIEVFVYVLNENVTEHLYTDFTEEEKALFNDTVGLVIPFIPNDEYCVEPYDDASGEPCVRFYTIGNTQAEFEAYLELFSIYSYEESKIDEYGDTWYFYSSGDVRIAVTYFYHQDAYRVETFTYISESSDETEHLYTDFTEEEKTLFNDLVGLVIPFVPNDEYYVEEYAFEDEIGINFYAFGNTQAEFDAYRSLFSSYSYDGSENDEYGDAWYYYSTGDVCVDMTFYYYEGNYVVDVYVYIMNEDEDEDVPDHLYNNFTAEEKALFNDLVGLVIPFVPNDEYHIREIEVVDGKGVNFYTFGNTQAEFEAYLDLFSSFNNDGTQEDEFGYTWYLFSKNNVLIDITYYFYEDSYVIEVFVYAPNENEDVTEHLYTDFTNEEKALFNDLVGLVIPFIPNNEYYATKYELDTFGKNCVHFYTVGNTQAEFEAYLELFSSYNLDDTFEDEYGDLWYYYSSGNVYIDVTYYFYNENYILDVYVYLSTEGEGDTDPSDHLYTEFTEEEKALFNEAVDFVIPFLPNDQYYVETYETWNESGVFFYTIGNTESEFNNYLSLFNTYSFIGSEVDEFGDTWYHYSNGEAFIRLAYYIYEDAPYAIAEVYLVTDDWTEEEWDDPSIELLPNDGKGLPEDADGIYDVDFTESEYVQNVSDQKYYSNGCPTTGSPAVLVIPVEFSDITAQSKGYTIENLEQIFYGNNLSYYSLYDYFRISSQNQLTLDITIVDTWFRPANSSSYYKEMSASHPNENEQELGTQLILDEALAYLATFMDLSKFDSDNNGYIDAVVLVNTTEIDSEDSFHWAYRYWNWYKDEGDAPYKYDDVSANDYVWIPYQFMFEAYDENGYLVFDQSNPLNPYTFIHEFSHVLGADDYYDTSGETTVLGGLDIMDSTMGDHNPYTKFNYGWITTSKLIVTDSSVTVNLEAFAKDGDTIILANNWDETLGAYQEYYIIVYYTMTGLNAGDGGYFDQNAILVYHINATLQVKYDEQKSPYIVHNNNTSVGPQSTRNNLIEYVISGDDDRLYTAGETLPTTTDDSGNELIYTFIVDAITEEYATITFTKK